MYAICEDRLENFFEKKGGFYLISVCLNLTSYKEDIKKLPAALSIQLHFKQHD